MAARPATASAQLGRLEYGRRPFAGAPELADDPAHAYAWVMTDYWETNFATDLGGFHEFRYAVLWGREFADEARALEADGDANQELCCFRLND